jgi:PhzF family phenazine biosynthesis protein
MFLLERGSRVIRWRLHRRTWSTDKQMQALAREMNLSETTFILPRERELEATDGTTVRIFTTREGLTFAGHPTRRNRAPSI